MFKNCFLFVVFFCLCSTSGLTTVDLLKVVHKYMVHGAKYELPFRSAVRNFDEHKGSFSLLQIISRHVSPSRILPYRSSLLFLQFPEVKHFHRINRERDRSAVVADFPADDDVGTVGSGFIWRNESKHDGGGDRRVTSYRTSYMWLSNEPSSFIRTVVG